MKLDKLQRKKKKKEKMRHLDLCLFICIRVFAAHISNNLLVNELSDFSPTCNSNLYIYLSMFFFDNECFLYNTCRSYSYFFFNYLHYNFIDIFF